MGNEVKYMDIDWGEEYPIAGERLATNGRYTGEHLGTPMQDAIDDKANKPHFVEEHTVRYGTIAGDVADKNFPAKAIAVDQNGNKYDSLQDAINGATGE